MTFPFELSDKLAAELVAHTQVIIDKETARTRMALLNKLKAAPSQSNRAMVTHFLIVKKWIKDQQTPDDWPLRFMPKDDKDLLKLAEEIDIWHMKQMQGAEVPQ